MVDASGWRVAAFDRRCQRSKRQPGVDPSAERVAYRVHGGRPEPAAQPCEAGCGFDPFGWLARLFGGDREDAASASPKPAPKHAEESLAGRAPAHVAPGPGDEPDAELALETLTLTAEPEPADGDLRTEEVVARIWIAPFVDANGVYREASHVRVVLEPAGWRLR